MTGEEQLDWLCRLRSEIYVYMPKEWLIPMNDALDMAIKALSQEPCEKPTTEEAIKTIQELMIACTPDSKYYRVGQMAISAILENEELSKDLDEALREIDEYEQGKKDALSQEPIDEWQNGYDMGWEEAKVFYEEEPCDDAISRNDMLDAVGHGTTYTSLEVQKIIKGLPSVNTVPCTDAVSRDFQIGDEVRIIGSDPIYDDCDVGWVIRNASEKVKTMYVMRNDGSAEEEAKAEWYKTGRHNAMLAEVIKALPSVTQKSGKWIDDGFYAEGHSHKAFHCSKCGHNVLGFKKDLSKYCPNCGAKMVKPQESEE